MFLLIILVIVPTRYSAYVSGAIPHAILCINAWLIDNAFVIIRRITSLYVPIFFYLFKMSGILSE